MFRQIYGESLKVKKETLLDLKKYNREKIDKNLNLKMNQIESMENLYRIKFEMLNEQLKSEKESSQVREKAQNLYLRKVKVEIKNKLEEELKLLQEKMQNQNDILIGRKERFNF